MQFHVIAGGVAVIVALLAWMLWMVRKAGRDAQRAADLDRQTRVKNEQLDAANRRALTRDELIKRMRERGL